VVQRATVVPRDIRRHDERVRNRDEDLGTWVEDDNRWLARETSAKLQVARAHGVAEGGAPAQIRQKLSTIVVQRYRDQLRDAERVRREVQIEEGFLHRWVRSLRGRPIPELDAPARAKPITDRWERDASGATDLRAAACG